MAKKVVIFGCGPGGLMVAHAAELNNWNFLVYSKKVKSVLHGAQYLHTSIMDIELPDPVMLNYRLNGTPVEYRQKVYGDAWDGQTSPEDYAGDHLAWDLREAYEFLWNAYEDYIVDTPITSEWQLPRPSGRINADLVISTVPRTVWDNNNENFKRSYIWAQGGLGLDDLSQDDFTVICDGTKLANWYRSSLIFGQGTLEWPQWWNTPFASVTPPSPGAVMVTKPLEYTGSAAQDFIHLGRYAQWQKGVLTSDVFRDSMEIFANDAIQEKASR